MKPASYQSIAITGMACRFPAASSLREFWSLLTEGRDGIGPIPAQRWDADAVFDPDAKALGKTNSRHGGFIENVDRFDAAFFGISRREAAQMDPQQRILLEIAYEAIEDAGLAPTALAGSDTAVFIGAMTNDYFRQQLADAYRRIDVHTGSGAGLCMLANRLSYQFDLRGPSATVDTACSSSLVAVFQACQSLWTRQSRLALAGGVNVMLDPAFNVFYAKAGLSAPDGRCKTFSAAANGIGRGEGAAVIVLKRLEDALADRDPIYAVIRGGAVNHDGRSNGLTQPNRWAQEQLLRQAFQHASIDPHQLHYIELHGTGTLIGDPIEANALGAVLSEGEPRQAPCLVGSVKTNLGHLEAAAGIAGLVKLALSLAHSTIPPSLWFDAPNPHIDFALSPLRVNAQLSSWPTTESGRLGGISSFGLGGTNAHLVLQSAPVVHPDRQSGSTQAPAQYCLFISARSEVALKAQAVAYSEFLGASAQSNLSAVCATALGRKAVHDFRLSAIGPDTRSLIDALQAFAAGLDHPGLVQGRYRSSHRPLVLAVPQHLRIDRQRWSACLDASAMMRECWNECRTTFAEHSKVMLPRAEELLTGAQIIADSRDIRAWHFSIQYALVKQALAGVCEVEAVVADGFGQLAALCAADAISLTAAVRWLDADLPPDLPHPAALLEPRYSVRFDFACGMNPSVQQINWLTPSRSCYERINSSTEYVNPDVLVMSLDEDGDLARPLDGGEWFALGAGPDAWRRLFARLALKHSLNWRAWMNDDGFIRLPAYQWQRESFWLSPSLEGSPTTIGASAGTGWAATGDRPGSESQSLLGSRVDAPTPAWQSHLSARTLSYLPDHRVQGSMVLPGAGYVEIGLAVHHATSGQAQAALKNLVFHSALVIETDQEPRMHVGYDEQTQEFSVYSQQSGGASWHLHARGILSLQGPTSAAAIDLAELRRRCTIFTDGQAHYRNMQERGFDYGPYFQGVRELWLDPSGGRVLARIQGHADLQDNAHQNRLHPTLFDAALQSTLTTLTARGDFELYIPTGIDELQLYQPPANAFWCYGGLQRTSPGTVEGEIVLFDDAGNVLAQARGVRAKALTRHDRDDLKLLDQWLYAWAWRPEPLQVRSPEAGRWLAFVHGDVSSNTLMQSVAAAGAGEIVQVRPGTAFRQHSREHFTARTHSKADLAQLLTAVGKSNITGIVYCWGIGTPADSNSLLAGDTWALPLVHLLQTLHEESRPTPVPLIVVTRGVQSAPTDETVDSIDGLMQAPLLGLARVAVNEYADIRVRTVDIDADAATLGSLAAEIVSAGREDEIALRGGQRFVHRMVRVPSADLDKASASCALGNDGTYLITGGFGGFGLEIAEWLVAQGARRLVLVGRRGASTALAQQAVERLQASGARVLAVAADISQESAVAQLVEKIRAELPPLKGVFHAAAALDDAPISHLEAQQIDTAMGAKALGAWHLHRYTLADRLDHFILFSSIASMVGGAGQASYAMACSYLDALARYRRARDLPAVSINWGALGQVGMATRFGDVEKYLSGSGVGLFTPLQAIQLLERTLRWNPVELGVAKMDWQRWAALYPTWAASAKYVELLSGDQARPTSVQETQLVQQLLALPEAARAEAVARVLIELLAQTMETTPEEIDPGVSLTKLGLDSLMAMDLQVAIEKSFAVKVPMLALMKGNNVEQLAQQVGASIAAACEAATSELPAVSEANDHELQELDLEGAERMIARLGDLADDEVDRMLGILTRTEETGQ